MPDGTDASGQTHGPVKLDPTVDFVAGTIAGVASLVVTYPLDTVKVRFQDPVTFSKYRTTFNAVTTIVREERVRGLYKGITSPLAGIAFMNGLVFASYGFLLKLQLKSDAQEPTLTQITLAGAGSGVVAGIITTPVDLIKIRQQGLLHTQPSTMEIIRSVIKKRGVTGLYRGLTVTALRDVGYGAYFATYEGTCRYFRKKNAESGEDKLPWPALLLAGGLAGITGWGSTFPLDVVKTRVQSVDYDPTGTQPYQSTLSTIRHSYRSEGAIVFLRGLVPTLIRAIPANMATFAVFEGVVHILS